MSFSKPLNDNENLYISYAVLSEDKWLQSTALHSSPVLNGNCICVLTAVSPTNRRTFSRSGDQPRAQVLHRCSRKTADQIGQYRENIERALAIAIKRKERRPLNRSSTPTFSERLPTVSSMSSHNIVATANQRIPDRTALVRSVCKWLQLLL